MSKERLEDIKENMKVFKATNSVDEFEKVAAETLLNHGDWLIKQAELFQELEKDFGLCDSTIFMVDLIINNASTSDDEKREEIRKQTKKYYKLEVEE